MKELTAEEWKDFTKKRTELKKSLWALFKAIWSLFWSMAITSTVVVVSLAGIVWLWRWALGVLL
jgi:hypothetical protein